MQFGVKQSQSTCFKETCKSGIDDISLMRTPWVGRAELGILAKTTEIQASVMLSYNIGKRSFGTHSLLSTTVV
jgi:hypothetical protein